MTPLAELTAWKLLLICLACIAVAVCVVVFAGLLLRELAIEVKVRRSRKCMLLTVPEVRQEWGVKDPPAWERLPPHKTWRLRAGLRGMGE